MWLSNLIAVFFLLLIVIFLLFLLTFCSVCLRNLIYFCYIFWLYIYIGKFCANSWASSNNKILIKDKIHIIFSHITKILLEPYITCDW